MTMKERLGASLILIKASFYSPEILVVRCVVARGKMSLSFKSISKHLKNVFGTTRTVSETSGSW